MTLRHRVLVVDDETSMRELLEIILGGDGYEVQTRPDVDAAVACLGDQNFDAVLTDLRIGPDRDAGMRLLSWLSEHAPDTPAIMMTAYGSVETAIEAMKRGASDYIMKPFKNDEVRLVMRRAIEQRNLVRENVALKRAQADRGRIENIIGSSPAIEAVRTMIRRVAALPSTVAIHGESGVGKELVARGIHQLSDRANKPFVAINCGAFPEALLESELVGHKRGSFTGAVEDKEGLFVVANGGSLFLDEIGEMPLSLQVKLLRVLDNHVVMPVGGTSGIQVNVRIISATNRDLEERIRAGAFREDLYYRLNVIPINVPPLRDRADDIPMLARHFASMHAQRMGRQKIVIAPEAEAALAAFHWPGNVRELMNVLERAVALCAHDHIEIADLPDRVTQFVSPSGKTAHALPPGGLDLEALVADLEMDLIQQALRNARHSQKRAAELLGLTPRSLRYRLQKYGLDSKFRIDDSE